MGTRVVALVDRACDLRDDGIDEQEDDAFALIAFALTAFVLMQHEDSFEYTHGQGKVHHVNKNCNDAHYLPFGHRSWMILLSPQQVDTFHIPFHHSEHNKSRIVQPFGLFASSYLFGKN